MQNHLYRGPGVHLTLLVLLMASWGVKGRQWQEIVDHDIARKSNIDSSRYELKMEADPFLKPGEKSPTKIPTVPSVSQPKNAWTQIDALKPEAESTNNPNAVPTKNLSTENTEESIEQNGPATLVSSLSASGSAAVGGCQNGFKYEVHMMDTWGDGWDQTVITIAGIDSPTSSMEITHTNSQGEEVVSISKTIELASANKKEPVGQIFQGGLQQGFHDSADICLLPNQCYQLIATGGEFSDEVSWELRPASNDPDIEMGPILSGGASTGCTFSLPNESGHYFCPKTCSDEIPATETTNSPPVVENFEPEEDGEVVEAEARADAVPRENPVTQLMAGAASAGSSESASTIWSKFKAGNQE